MKTERYTIIFFGVDSRYYTDDFVAHLWEQSANKEYLESGIFITARVSLERLVCGEIRGCNLGNSAHIVITARNPAEVADKNTFWDSYRRITKGVRENLGNPSTTIIVENVEYFYFTEVK